jgi:protocatechuate 3,4-dioxygenase beta subunit
MTDKLHLDEHDRGLAFDMETVRLLGRRRALGMLGLGAGAIVLAGCGPDDSSSSANTGSATATPTPTPTSTSASGTAGSSSCTAFATETNGPYPADGTNQSRGTTSNVLPMEAFQRSDIRSSVIGSGTVAGGVEVELTLTLVDVNDECAVLAGYAVYVWHCNASGQYSLYDLPAETYLRGVQVSDENGQVTFTTIFPGCYAGRYPHIHFEVFSSLANATSGNYAVLISQLAMPAAACTSVYSDTATYGNSAPRFANTSISSDNVFGDNSGAQTEVMTLEMSGSASAGYTATATVGIAT